MSIPAAKALGRAEISFLFRLVQTTFSRRHPTSKMEVSVHSLHPLHPWSSVLTGDLLVTVVGAMACDSKVSLSQYQATPGR